jgi:hypothetical protein
MITQAIPVQQLLWSLITVMGMILDPRASATGLKQIIT